MQLFKYPEGLHSLHDYRVSLTARSLCDKTHPSKLQTEKYTMDYYGGPPKKLKT